MSQWVVRYAKAQAGYDNFPHSVWKLVQISGNFVWGVDEGHVFEVLNRSTSDGSGRSFQLWLFDTKEEAVAAAKRGIAELGA